MRRSGAALTCAQNSTEQREQARSDKEKVHSPVQEPP